VWFDSGSSWAGVVKARGLAYPANLYLEGSDQHRGWFQSSLLTGVAATGKAPYKTILTHGFVLDEKGYKMSKSLGNVVDPRLIIEGGKNQKTDPAFGADTLRLWVASTDYTSDVLIGMNILKQTSDNYRKLRGTLRFLMGNIGDFDPAANAVPYEVGGRHHRDVSSVTTHRGRHIGDESMMTIYWRRTVLGLEPHMLTTPVQVSRAPNTDER
jgi:isoleucyl-tRNA synthetase